VLSTRSVLSGSTRTTVTRAAERKMREERSKAFSFEGSLELHPNVFGIGDT
jgi:hypothetical protein